MVPGFWSERISSPPIAAATASVAAAIGVAVIVAVNVTAGLRCRLDEACWARRRVRMTGNCLPRYGILSIDATPVHGVRLAQERFTDETLSHRRINDSRSTDVPTDITHPLRHCLRFLRSVAIDCMDKVARR